MSDDIEIRESVPGDLAAIEKLYPGAFPDEDLLPLVAELLDGKPWGLSLVAFVDGVLAGHAYFTRCTVAGNTGGVGLLGPVAVAPAFQRQGVGSALIDHGIARMEREDIVQVCVLGDPAYYGRFGFVQETELMPPYPLPDEWSEAWQSVCLRGPDERLRGVLSVPQPWRKPALWAD